MEERYSDRQMALILKRAAERQAAGGEAVHTLAEIQQIAQQVGISAELVAEAAAKVATHGSRGAAILGDRAAYTVTAHVPGAPRELDRNSIVETIRDHMPQLGAVNALPDGVEWYAGPADNKIAVTVTSTEAGTTVRIDGRQHGPKTGLYLAASTVSVVAMLAGLIASPETAVVLGVSSTVLTFGGARLAWDRIARRARLRALRLKAALVGRMKRASLGSGDPPVGADYT